MRPISAIVLAVLLLFVVDESLAIPAFARKYDTSCLTCHTPFPRLKKYGETFAANGFQLPGKEPSRFTRETGDPDLLLMRELPIALRLQGFFSWEPNATGRSEFQSPYLFKLLSGGQIARNVAYYFYFFFSELGSVTGIEDAWVMFNDVFGSSLDITVGQFQVSDPLFKRELRMTLEDYRIYNTQAGLSRIDLTYDRGVMFNWGLPTGTDLVLEVVNGGGIGPAEPGLGFDNDKYKNVMLRASQDIGDLARIGAFGYLGREEQDGQVNRAWLAGPDVSVALGPAELNFQYVERRDDNPFFTVPEVRGYSGDFKTRGLFAELIVTPNDDHSTWYGTLLWNWVDSQQDSLDYRSLTGQLSYMLARNLRLVGEYTYGFKTDVMPAANKVSLGFIAAF